MSHAQFIKTPAGEELVIIPRAEYDAMCAAQSFHTDYDEDADDVAIYDSVQNGLIHSTSYLPAEVSKLMLQGNSRLKAIRRWKDMTQLHIEFKTGISQGYLSELENGLKTGTPYTLELLAKALEVPVEWIA